MKKLAILISLVFSLFMLVVPAVMADMISSGDYVKLIAYNSVDNAGIMTYQISHNGGNSVAFNYDTFCIQENIYINPNQWYQVALSNMVGPYSPSVIGEGPLNGAVDYLFYRYKNGFYNTELADPVKQADLQKVLWSLQGSGSPYTSSGTSWASDLLAYSSMPNQSWGTLVINIYTTNSDGSRTDVQNQLYNQVPEPSAILLLGFGLVGIAGIRRKFKK